MRVVWTRNATRELRSVHDAIAQTSRQYARALVDRITQRTKAHYRIHQGRIQILSVVHGARSLPREVPENPD